MNSKKKISTEALICIILGIVVVILAAIITGVVVLGRSSRDKKAENTQSETFVSLSSATPYTTAIDTILYDGPAANSKPLAQIPKDSSVSLMSIADNNYYKVIYNGITGYVNSEHVIDSNLLKAQENAQKKYMYIINANPSAKLYAAASGSSDSLAELPLGTQVTAYTNVIENGFEKVEYGGNTGYVEVGMLTDNYEIAKTQIDQKNKNDSAEAERAAAAAKAASLPAGSSATAPQYPMYVYNVQNAIYLRTNPSDDADIITTIPLGTQVYYIDTWGGWYKISYNGAVGYSKSQYLTTTAPRPERPSNYRTIGGVDNSAYLRIRAVDDTSPSNIICEIPKGSLVEYLGSYGSYGKVRYQGSVGYVLSKYLY